MKTILVTGGAGFIGSHLCEALLKNNNKVICIDNLFTGKKENIRHLLKDKNFTFMKHDIITPFFPNQKIDQIYNLACPASPVHYQYNAIRTVKANTIGVINMLGLAKRHNARFLQASTSEVYGDPLVHPQSESYKGNVNCTGPRSCYDEGKRVAETLCFDYHRQNKVDICVVRIFNTYGPRMAPDDGRVVSNFIVQALKNEPITIYGKGTQTRSFCYVSDMVSGLIKAMSKKNYHGPVNLGNPDEFTMNELAKKIKQITGSGSKLVYKPLPIDDPLQRKPDIRKAKKELGWEPIISINKGLSSVIFYFRQKLKLL